MPITRIDWYSKTFNKKKCSNVHLINPIHSLFLPKVAERFGRQEPHNYDQHYRLAEQSETGMMHLHRIDIVIAVAGTAIVNEFAAYFKEYFDTVN